MNAIFHFIHSVTLEAVHNRKTSKGFGRRHTQVQILPLLYSRCMAKGQLFTLPKSQISLKQNENKFSH